MSCRRPLAALLAALGLAASWAAAAQTTPVGQLADRRGKSVTGGLPAEPVRELKVPEGLPERMRVLTGEASGARIAIGRRQGAVRMGPESELELNRAIVDLATGVVSELDFWTQLGQLRFLFFRPPPDESRRVLGAAPGEVWIHVPKSGTEIRLLGTDVQVEVAPDGSTKVFVIEGAVTVKSRDGATVRVEAGQWTWIGIDGPPRPPGPFGGGTGSPGPGAGPGSFPDDEGIPPDPPGLNPRYRPVPDLPKAGWL